MASLPIKDCTTPLEDLRLLYAKDYMRLVSSGVSGLGDFPNDYFARTGINGLGEVNSTPWSEVTQWGYGGWPPGARPSPDAWKDPKTGITWTLKKLDGKWLYQSSQDERYFITTSNLYSLMGLPKNPITGAAFGPVRGQISEDRLKWYDRSYAGVNAKWWVGFGIAGYLLYKGAR